MEVTIETMIQRWSSLERPLFKGKLIDVNGCKCAQGDVLFCSGFSDDQLRQITQGSADREVANLLRISVVHSVLLRQVNDSVGGSPQIVLTNPEKVIGDKAPLLLAFWMHLDSLSNDEWNAARNAARNAASDDARYAERTIVRSAAWGAAWNDVKTDTWTTAWNAVKTDTWTTVKTAVLNVAWGAASSAEWVAAGNSGWDVARDVADASSEIQGIDILERDGKRPCFLSLFGFNTWDKVRGLIK